MRAPGLVALWVVAGALAAACGSAGGPPRGPDHTPSASPEAESECPAEWKAAKAAREEMLGSDSAAMRARTAKAVLAQASCETVVLAAGTFSPGVHNALLEQVAALRNEQRDTQNLYNEVAAYGVPLYRVAAIVGRGSLAAHFAQRLRELPMPTDITEVGEKAAFKSEIAEIVDYFETEADRELRDGITLSTSTPGAEAHRDQACKQLATLGRAVPNTCGSGG